MDAGFSEGFEFDSVVDSIKISGAGFKRCVSCPYCRQKIARTITTHLRRNHPEQWDEWCKEFLYLFNHGMSLKQIMRRFSSKNRFICTWRVIEKEIKRVAEEKGVSLSYPKKQTVADWEPRGFHAETTSIWSFGKRGNWAVHDGKYMGNWSPYVPRNLIRQYTKKGDWILDSFMGGGTTLIECWLLGRNCVGIDVSPHALSYCRQRLKEMKQLAKQDEYKLANVAIIPMLQDARHLERFKDRSFDMICTHPPYADALKYTHAVKGDLSLLHDLTGFYVELEQVAKGLFRVLKDGKYCAILIGDLRRRGTIVPLGFNVLERFKQAGFELREIIIKQQHHDRSNEFYNGKEHSTLRFRIAHEYLFVLRKPKTRKVR